MKQPRVSLSVIALLTLMPLSQQQKLQNVFDCGVAQIKITKLIVNGYNTSRGAWPWHVAIFHKYGREEEYVCGGTLVTQKHVITAEHCLRDKNGAKPLPVNKIFVRLGVHRLNSTEEETQQREIRETHRTDNVSQQDHRNDIVILEMTSEAEFGKYVHPACVSLTKDLTGELGTVIGWGVDERNKVSTVLKSAQLPVVNYFTCVKSDPSTFGAMLDEGMFCAGRTNGTAVCNGDSGGGIFFKENGIWYLGGIVSFSQMREDGSGLCYINGFGAFTRIHTYLAWIKSVTKLSLRISIDDGRSVSQSFDPTAYYANVLPQDCGISFFKSSNQRNETDVFEFPWMAILVLDKRLGLPDEFCVGTLIDKRYVLTSYRCGDDIRFIKHVRLGEHTVGNYTDCNKMGCAPPVKLYGIECIIMHPIAEMVDNRRDQEDEDEVSFISNDLALIRLDRDVTFEDHIRPICLPVSQSLRSLVRSQCFLTGWSVCEPDDNNWRACGNISALLKLPFNASDDCTYFGSKNEYSMYNTLCMRSKKPRRWVLPISMGSPLGCSVHYKGERVVQFGLFTLFENVFLYTLNIVNFMEWILVNIHP